MARTKITDEQILGQINNGLNNKQILDYFKMSSSGTAYKRIDKLRAKPVPKEFDLQLYDTITQNGKWYRVTEIGESAFTAKSVCIEGNSYGKGETLEICKSDYISGKEGYKKRPMPPVKTYIDLSLKKKPAIINKEFEDAVKEMERQWTPEQATDDLSELGQDPAWGFDRPVEEDEDLALGSVLDESNFAKKVADVAKAQIAEFVKAKESITRALEAESQIDVGALDVYNMLLEKYEG